MIRFGRGPAPGAWARAARRRPSPTRGAWRARAVAPGVEYIPAGAVVEETAPEEWDEDSETGDMMGAMGAPFVMTHGNLRLVHMGGLGADPSTVAEATGTDALVAFIKAWKLLPPGVTAADVAGLLDAAAAWGTKINASRPPQLFTDYDYASLMQDVAAAQAQAEVWRGRMPWFWQQTKYYPRAGAELQAVYKLLTRLYGNGAGVKGAAAVVRKAQKELVADLVKPSRWAWWQKYKWFIIAGGVLVGGTYAYPIVRRFLPRKAAAEATP